MNYFNRCLLTIFLVSYFGALAHADNGYMRVNQIGYEAGLPARAYLMTRASGSAKFSIIDSSGATAASGSVGALLGAWGHYSVYPIDFTLSTHDTYTIVMSNGGFGDLACAFEWIRPRISTRTPLANNLYFYENERDGADFIPTALRTARRTSQRCESHGHITSPTFDDDDNIIGSLVPDWRDHQRRRRMVGRRRLSEVRADAKAMWLR